MLTLEQRVTRIENHLWPYVPIPQLANWETRMKDYGLKAVAYLGTQPVTSDAALNSVYYDQDRVFQQMAKYTGDVSWYDAALKARDVYRYYYLKNSYRTQGFRNFTTGLRMNFERTGDPASKADVIGLSKNAAYAADGTPLAWTESSVRIREVSLAVTSYIDAERVGDPPRARRPQLVNQLYGHFNQMMGQMAPGSPQPEGDPEGFKPFMASMGAQALIRDWETTQDSRLLPALTALADQMWEYCWVPGSEAMWYSRLTNTTKGSPDLNLLIAPVYPWLHEQTMETRHRDRADALFQGGVKFAWLGAPTAGYKQFNQNYWWSFDYVSNRLQ